MSNYKFNLVSLVIILLNLLQTVRPQISSLQCFKCSSKLTPGCEDPFDEEQTALTTACSYPENVCIKHIWKKTPDLRRNEERTFRGCGTPEYCHRFSELDIEHCSVCFTSLCNSASFAKTPTIFIFLLIYFYC